VFFFVVSINILIYSGNLITVLLGWDGLGITSFLLVIYYQNSYSLGAGLITVLTNRLGDVGLILSVGLLLYGGH
jgi:NADH-ubiquinone oxidoreductase chain 5